MPIRASTFRRVAAVASAAVLPATAAAQDVVVHTTLDGWLAGVSNPAVDTFDDLPFALTSSPIDRAAGAYSYRASAPQDFFAAGVPADRWLSTNSSADAITLSNFSANVRGVGGFFFLTDLGGALVPTGQITIAAVSGAQTRTVTLTNAGTTTFWGITSDQAISSLTFLSTQGATTVWPTANNVRLGAAAQVIPEPSTYVLLAAGIGALALVARRRHAPG